jgi:hypothetical protein
MSIMYEVADWKLWEGGGRPLLIAMWGVADETEVQQFRSSLGQAATWGSAFDGQSRTPLLYLVLRGGTADTSIDLEYAIAPEERLLHALEFTETYPAHDHPVMLGFFTTEGDFNQACAAIKRDLTSEALAVFGRNALYFSSFRVEPGTSDDLKRAS